MKTVKKILLSLVPISLLLAFGAEKSAERKQYGRDNPPPGAWFATVPGFRRAKSSEVTPEMSAEAHRVLYLAMGRVVLSRGGTFKMAVESHYNESKGWHKGVSIFVRQS